MIVWAMLVVILFFLVLSGFVFNAGKTVAAKIETQNASDAIAYSSSVWVARGMNTLTATNHLMGELNALYVMHHALGGRHLDERSSDNRTWDMIALNAGLWYEWYVGAEAFPAVGPLDWHRHPFPCYFSRVSTANRSHYNIVRQHTKADRNSTIYQAKRILKLEMIAAFAAHRQATKPAFYPIPWWNPFPHHQAEAPTAFWAGVETALAAEYQFLNLVESVAIALKGPKRAIPGIIAGLHAYQRTVKIGAPAVIADSVGRLKEHHGLEAAYAIGAPLVTLPVEPERGNLRTEKKSQMIRATYPWVVQWRKPVLITFTAFTPTCFASSFYAEYSDQYTLEASTWLRKSGNYRADLTVINRSWWTRGRGIPGKSIRLPVVRGLNDVPDGVSKGREKWNNWRARSASSIEIDKLFTHMGFARRTTPTVASDSIFRQENPDGIVCFAQSMVYNANEKRRLRRSEQPRVTWDTLNWNGPVQEYQSSGFFVSSARAIRHAFAPAPVIKLNWQAKLTPVTNNKLLKSGAAVSFLDPQIRNVLIAGREGLALTNH